MTKTSVRKLAKGCYEHIGGQLGKLLLEKFLKEGWLTKDAAGDKHFYMTEKGTLEFTKLGIDLSLIKS
ncbi:ArsR family transcriptional regulator [Siphonobacter sp. BAB-5385]|uniref:ArsR family transcriptional regulator n=1 Tax=Siphonobacter sp. BAB-5385 TaxID=1864822 RepID=UPI000B9E1303|nr:ArsR family transcriptional regulator [Siphonobacter sp. BAB-5385]OZI07107.1 ArsR family transcriptional regulator [Siphonobacter sp. BAB-5385]